MDQPTSTNSSPRMAYNLPEAAHALTLSVSTLKRAISHGLVHSMKMGKGVRLAASEVDRLAREGMPPIPPGFRRSGDAARKPNDKTRKP